MSKPIKNFEEEDLDFLTKKEKIEIVSLGRKGVLKLCKLIHFNKNAPQNKNIMIDHKGNILIKSGKKWEDREDVIEEIITNLDNHMDTIYSEVEDDLDKKGKKKYKKYADKMRNRQKNNIIEKLCKKVHKIIEDRYKK